MKTVRKYFSLIRVKELIDLYDRFNTDFLPKINCFSLQTTKPYIDFNWVNGKPVEINNLSDAFNELGKFHRSNFIKDETTGFSTLCHGDFHAGNIIETNNGIILIDVAYLHIGNNYDDLDYLDFFNWFESSTHPWMIKDKQYFEKYLEGAKLKIKKNDQNVLKKTVTKKILEKFIKNGIKNNIDTNLEKRLLENIKMDLSDIV